MYNHTMNRDADDLNSVAAKHFHDTAKAWSDRYAQRHEMSPAFLVRRTAVDALIDRLVGDRPLERAIDFGCGTGPYLPMLARRAREVKGIDIAPGMIEEARHNVPAEMTGVEVMLGSVLELPFPDDHFDLAVSVGVIEYFAHPAVALREMFRVMKPGAPIVITLPNRAGIARLTGLPRTLPLMLPPRWKVGIGAVANRLRGREPDPSKYYLGETYTNRKLQALFDDVGVDIVATITSGYHSVRIAGVGVPGPLEAALSRALEERRDAFPWNQLGNNLIVAAAKRVTR